MYFRTVCALRNSTKGSKRQKQTEKGKKERKKNNKAEEMQRDERIEWTRVTEGKKSE